MQDTFGFLRRSFCAPFVYVCKPVWVAGPANPKIVLTGIAMGICLVVSGCGSGDGDSATQPAAINNSNPDQASSPASTDSGTQPDADNPLHPIVEIETSLGKITVKLDAERAPLTVDNFLSYVDDGFYDQTIFHQVHKDYVVLGGTYTAEGAEKNARTPIRNEADNGLRNLRGTIGMARQADAIDSATSQFYFNVTDNPVLDHKDRTVGGYGYCAFGKVIDGANVIEKISELEVHDTDRIERTPIKTVLIKSVRRLR